MSREFNVYSDDGTPVRAKYLEIHGRPIFDSSGRPYIVPADFDWDTYIDKFKKFQGMEAAGGHLTTASTMLGVEQRLRFLYEEFHANWPSSPADVQRTYNGRRGTKRGDFVSDFSPVASFLYGAACAAVGLPQWGALAGGGAQNLLSRLSGTDVDTSGAYWNAPANVPNIERGWSFYSSGASPSPEAKEQKKEQYGMAEKQHARQHGPKAETPEWPQTAAGSGTAFPAHGFVRSEKTAPGTAGQATPRNFLLSSTAPQGFTSPFYPVPYSGSSLFPGVPLKNFLGPQPMGTGLQGGSPPPVKRPLRQFDRWPPVF